MAASKTEPLVFEPSSRVLEFAIGELEDVGSRSGSAVSPSQRRAAFAIFEQFGLETRPYPPGWRHDYAALGYGDLQWSSGRAVVRANPPTRDASASAVENAGGIVHVGSTYLQPQHDRIDPRVKLLALADAKRLRGQEVAATHGTLLDARDDRFVALATAFQNCGAYVEIPSGVDLAAPLQILWMPQPAIASAVFAHTVVRVGRGSRATIVERHLGEGDSFSCATVEIDLAEGAQLDYVVIDDADDGARILSRRAARCAEGARFGAYTAHLGGALVRDRHDVRLDGDGASAVAAALFFARGYSNIELDLACLHRGMATASETIVRDAASDRARGRFFGNIAVDADAAGARATMRDDALVLSRDAYLEATPSSEIDCSQVAISHAATVGTLDEDALFYVGSRGVSRKRAERMMALAFFEAAIARFPSDSIRDEVRTLLDLRLEEIPETFAQ